MANSYTFNQIATILNSIVADAQGRTANIATTPRNTAEFVTMAQVALSTGTDPVMHSLQQLINSTVFRYRPYTRKFQSLETSDLVWGNTVRKVTPIFTDSAQNNPMYDSLPADGNSVDPWGIKRPKVLQTLFTGAEQHEIQAPTVFRDQLNSAFRGPDELGEFLASQITEVSNEMEQQSEQLSRMTVANFIGAKIQSDADSVIHLLTEYNTETGLSLTATTVMQPDNFPAFIRWAYARIQSISDLMSERSVRWHKALTGYTILRHTPAAYQRLYLFAPAMEQIKTMVLSGLYHNDLLTVAPHESVNFWQNGAKGMEDKINVTCKYLDSDGTVKTATVNQDKVFGVLFDKEAMGVNVFNEGAYMTHLNPRGLYYNTFHKMFKRHFQDTTENGVVFLLD